MVDDVPDTESMVGSRVPRSLVFHVGVFVVAFSALDAELNQLIRHVARVSERAGRALVGAAPGYETRAQLLEDLAIAHIKNKKNRDKVLRLARDYRRVAEYRHALLHHEFLEFVPPATTIAAHRRALESKAIPVELSMAWLIYNSNLSGNLAGRMHQYRTKDPMWHDDKHFPWHEEPLTDPDTVPHLTRRPKRH